MNKKIKGLCLVMASLMAVSAFAGCSNNAESSSSAEESSSAVSEQSEDSSAAAEETTKFDYSKYFDDNGYIKDVTALDYVTLPESLAIDVPAENHVVTAEALQSQIDSLLSSYSTSEQITDRAVADGDTLNIDYVGSVDGAEFEGGSTEGAGTEVTIGVTSYIDNFLEQLIGHTPGENFDITVTFPDPYENNTDLSGKEAVFNVTINYIVNKVTPELNDEFVATNLSASRGWNTVEDMRAGLSQSISESMITNYINQYVLNNYAVSEIPQQLTDFQKESNAAYYAEMAEYYSMDVDEYVSTYLGYDTLDALLEGLQANMDSNSKSFLIYQALAEKQGLTTITEDDLKEYFLKNYGSEDYSSYEASYSVQYLKAIVLQQKMMDVLVSNAVLADVAPAEEQPAEEQQAEQPAEQPAEEQPAEQPAEEQPAEQPAE